MTAGRGSITPGQHRAALLASVTRDLDKGRASFWKIFRLQCAAFKFLYLVRFHTAEVVSSAPCLGISHTAYCTLQQPEANTARYKNMTVADSSGSCRNPPGRNEAYSDYVMTILG